MVRSLHRIYAPAAVYVFRPWADVLAAESLVRLGRHEEARARVTAWLEDWKRSGPGAAAPRPGARRWSAALARR